MKTKIKTKKQISDRGTSLMNTSEMPGGNKYDRRRFLGIAAMGVAAFDFATIGSAPAQSSVKTPADLPTIKPGTNTSFGPLKQIDARPPEYWLRGSGPEQMAPRYFSALLHGRTVHLQLCRCHPLAGVVGLPGDRPVSARLWHDAISIQCNHALNGEQAAVALDIIALLGTLSRLNRAIRN